MGWVRGRGKTARDGGEESRIQGEKRRRKIGPMVIDYLPCILRIPYSDRPHGPKIEPSITGALLSLSSLFRSSPSSSPFTHSRSTYSREILPSRSAHSSIFLRRATKDVIPDLRNAVLIKRCSDTCYRKPLLHLAQLSIGFTDLLPYNRV